MGATDPEVIALLFLIADHGMGEEIGSDGPCIIGEIIAEPDGEGIAVSRDGSLHLQASFLRPGKGSWRELHPFLNDEVFRRTRQGRVEDGL